MTTNDATTLVCPNCASTNTAIGGSGSAICTDCAHLWNPNDVQYPPTPIYVPPLQATVEEVFGTPADDDNEPKWERYPPTSEGLAQYRRDGNSIADAHWFQLHKATPVEVDPDAYNYETEKALLVGGVATLEGGQVATVVAFTGSETVIVALSTGDLQEVPMSDVERIMPPIVIPDPVVIPDDVDAMPADMQLALTLAQVIIRAGCESVTGTGASVTPGVPPVGYLPADEALHSVVERAAGLAVGMLIEAFGLDVDAILRFVGAVDESAEVATETTEVEDESSTSDE